jgi:short-subunit dehydrogenase
VAASQHYRSALVTGASSGIGWEIARVLAERGCDLVVVARRTDRLEQLASDLSGVKVEVITADLSTDGGVAIVEQRLRDTPVELLVNNAGIGSGGAFHSLPVEREAAEIRLNVLALVRLTHAALGPMVAARHGGILNVSSLAGDQPLRGFATYAATKSFVTSFSESIAAELRGTGVHVTVLKPGYVYTEMNPDSPDPASFAGRFWLQADDVARDALNAVERGRLTSVPGVHWRAVNGLVNALPHQLVRALTSRFDASA